MITVDDLSLSFVENIGFSRFCVAALPNYELKRCTCYSEHVDKLYDEVSQEVKNILADYEKISFTTDIWTVTHAAVSLLSLTGHVLSIRKWFCVHKSYTVHTQRKTLIMNSTTYQLNGTLQIIACMWSSVMLELTWWSYCAKTTPVEISALTKTI